MAEHLLPSEIHAQFEVWEAERPAREERWRRLTETPMPVGGVVYHYVKSEPHQARGHAEVES